MNGNPSRGKSQGRKFRSPRQPPPPHRRLHSGTNPGQGVGHDAAVPFPAIRETDLPADIVLTRLKTLRRRITGTGPSWQACCPAHPDLNPSLAITETREGVLLVHCFAGCETEDVLAHLDLTLQHLSPSLYALQFSKRRPQGVLSFYAGDEDTNAPVSEPTDEDCAEWTRLLKAWPIPPYALNQLAAHLDLPREALLPLEVGYNEDNLFGPCWIFPERDDSRRIVGLMRRYDNGRKSALLGSVRGLTIPSYDQKPPPGPVYLVEGASDVAALVSEGAFAIGRSSASGNPAEQLWLTRLLGRHPGREIIVVGEREESGAGQRGAEKLAAHLHDKLHRLVSWALPRKGFKDSREQVVAGQWSKGLRIQEVLT
jgi:hypothetical protein